MKGFSELLADLGAQLDAEAMTLQGASLRMAEHIQGQLACSRVSVWLLRGDPGRQVMLRIGGFDGAARAPITEPVDLREEELSAYFEALTQRGVYVCPDALADPNLAAIRESYLLPAGIGALLNATIGVNGSTWGVFCCAQYGATREWAPHELRLLKGFADAVSVRRARRRRREAEAAILMERLRSAQGLTGELPID